MLSEIKFEFLKALPPEILILFLIIYHYLLQIEKFLLVRIYFLKLHGIMALI